MAKKTAVRDAHHGWSFLSLQERVQRALPMAREILLGDGIEADPVPGHETILERLATLTGEDWFDEMCSTAHEAQRCDELEAAQALGIALGLLLRPEAFVGEGPR